MDRRYQVEGRIDPTNSLAPGSSRRLTAFKRDLDF
jgi:hypothetical protein